MKKLLALITLALAVVSGNSQSTNDFVKGFDFTGVAGISATRLNNLVDYATLADYRGLIIATNAAPDAATYTQWTNYLWLDVSVDPPVVKSWSPGGGSWSAASIGNDTVTSAMIVDGTIATADLGATIVLEGNLGAGAVTTSKIQDSAVTTVKITDANVTLAKMATDSVNSAKIVDDSVASADILDATIVAADIATGAVTSAKILDGTIATSDIADESVTIAKLADEGAALQLLRRNSGNTDYEFFTPTIVGFGSDSETAVITCSTKYPNLTSAPGVANGDEVLSLSYTPKASANTLMIEAVVPVTPAGNVDAIIALHTDASATATRASAVRVYNGLYEVLHLKYVVSAASTSARTYSIRVGDGNNANTIYVNGVAGSSTAIFGGAGTSVATLTVTELSNY